jgi:hypothetical protein
VKKVHILVEGQTEETFIRDILAPHFLERDAYLIATLATTKRVTGGPHFKGGIVSYRKLKGDVLRLLGDTSAAVVTTMIDFYGLPDDFPGRNTMPAVSCYERVAYLEKEFSKDIGDRRFLPYLALHEYEAMLFVAPEFIADALSDMAAREELNAVRAQFGSPEEIDDHPATCPSRRITSALPQYRKALHGPLIAHKIGIARIRNECRHFDRWFKELETSI